MNTPLILLLVVIDTIIGAFGSFFLKRGASRIKSLQISQIANPELVLGLSLYAIGTMLYIGILRMADLTIIYPLSSLSYVWVALISHKLLGENITPSKALGITFIILGTFVTVL